MTGYPFYNRQIEIKKLLSSFQEKVAKEKKFLGFIIRGKSGIGKTRLIEEFITRTNDYEILCDIPHFDPENHVIKHTCLEDNQDPYFPFIKITEEIYRQKKILNVLMKFFHLGLAIFSINDALKAFKELIDSMGKGKNENALIRKETKLFNKYRSLIKFQSRKHPLIIYIQNAQWIDSYSLKLIRKLVTDKDPFWGTIILEEEHDEGYEPIMQNLNQLISSGVFERIDLGVLDKSFPEKFFSHRFGENFITTEENDILYTVSEGCPGKLIEFIEDSCLGQGWIVKTGNKWIKSDDFFERIKPPIQKLIELIISLYEDKIISDTELLLIQRMSIMWGISRVEVNSIISMVKDIVDSGYRIIDNLRPGIVSKNCFLVLDISDNKFILEYVHVNSRNGNRTIGPRNINNPHILEAREVKKTGEGALIIWDFFEGVRSRHILVEAFTEHLNKNISKFLDISKGLEELHRNDIVHGFIKPESVIESKNGKYQLASFDHTIFYSTDNILQDSNWEKIPYLSPEQLESKNITLQSDIFSLGVLFYKSLTNRFPFHGRTVNEILYSIGNDPLLYEGYPLSLIPEEIKSIIWKCLNIDPEKRYHNAGEVYQDLKTIIVVQKKTVSPIQNHDHSKSPRLIPAFFISFVCVLLTAGIYFLFIKPPKPVILKDEITINVETENETTNNERIISSEVIQYLIIDDLMQSSDKVVLTDDQFNKIYPPANKEQLYPKTHVEATIINRDLNYELIVKVITRRVNNQTEEVKRFDFHDPSELLKGKISKVTEFIANTKNLNKSTFTRDWDAFDRFYHGEVAWLKLDKTNALKYLNEAIEIDSSFILAKLRLSEIQRFEGNNIAARKTLLFVMPLLGELSKADSLRALAIFNKINGKIRDAINNYKEIIQYLPARKEPYFELAEAYFDLRDIDNAKMNYSKSLELDAFFTPAINHYAYCFTHTGEHQKALSLFRKYVSIDSSANAYDSYGDGFMAAGIYDSAIWAKRKGLMLDPGLEYLYNSLSFIESATGEFAESEKNINNYLKLTKEPEMLIEGYISKAYLYFLQGDMTRTYDTCMKAFQIETTVKGSWRNSKISWLLCQVYLRHNDISNAKKEFKKLKDNVEQNNYSPLNYNEVFKYYLHCKVLLALVQNDTTQIDEIVKLFNGLLKDKIKDWSSPYDLAFFNTEFGKIYLQMNKTHKAQSRFEAALDYNPNCPLANLYLSEIYYKISDKKNASDHLSRYKKIWKGEN